MLLNTILALVPLVHTPPAPIPQDASPSLAWAVSDNALAGVYWSDPKGFVANKQKSAWVDFFKDARWLEVEGMDELFFEEEGELLALTKTIWDLLAGSRELVLWAEESAYINPNIYVAFQTTDGAIEAAVAQPNELWNGTKVTVDGYPIVAEELFALTWKDGLCVLHIGDDAGESAADIISVLQKVKAANKPAGLFESTPVGSDRRAGGIEAIFNLNGVLDMFPEGDNDIDSIPPGMLAEIRSIGWAYMSLTVGAGQAADMNLVMPFAEDGYIAKFLSFASDAGTENFKRVPADAYGAFVCNFDIAGAAHWIIEELTEAGILSEGEFEQAMQTAEETVGFHPFEDLLNYANGEMIQILFPAAEGDYPLQGVIGGSYGLMLAVVDSVEEVDASLAGLAEFASAMLEVEEIEATWGTKWIVNAMEMMEIEFGYTSSDLFINCIPGAVEKMEAHRAAGPEAPNLLTNATAKSVLNEIKGLTASIYSTAGMAEQLSQTFRMQFLMDPEMAEGMTFFESVLDTFDAVAADH
ncbi:MAG: hypothetical protein GY930_02630, partial [bacterium]|nr:hypothetical protein [bacterium]